jgi:hypothetical protein
MFIVAGVPTQLRMDSGDTVNMYVFTVQQLIAIAWCPMQFEVR